MVNDEEWIPVRFHLSPFVGAMNTRLRHLRALGIALVAVLGTLSLARDASGRATPSVEPAAQSCCSSRVPTSCGCCEAPVLPSTPRTEVEIEVDLASPSPRSCGCQTDRSPLPEPRRDSGVASERLSERVTSPSVSVPCLESPVQRRFLDATRPLGSYRGLSLLRLTSRLLF